MMTKNTKVRYIQVRTIAQQQPDQSSTNSIQIANSESTSMIQRMETNERMSQIVIHNNTVYLAGQVAFNAPGENVTEQTKDTLARIDDLLAKAGTNKSNILSATIWLSDINDFSEMNAVWDAWVSSGDQPARACVESKLAAPQFNVEIAVIAALN